MSTPVYRLPRRRSGTALFGATGVQVCLLGIGISGLAAGPTLVGGAEGVVAGFALLLTCVILGFVRVDGETLVSLLPVVAGYLLRGSTPSRRTPPAGAASEDPQTVRRASTGGRLAIELPHCLRSVELMQPRTGALSIIDGRPTGLLRDRRTGAITVVLDARGGPFGLTGPDEQHQRIAGWAHTISQCARDPRLTRLGWTVRSDLVSPSSPDRVAMGEAAAYQRIVEETAAFLVHHEVRLWLTVDPSRGRRAADAETLALGAAETLADRCRVAGLDVRGTLSIDGLLRTLEEHAAALPSEARATTTASEHAGLASRASLRVPMEGAQPALRAAPDLIVESWTAARIGDSWHRVLWIADWPAGALHPEWLSPLLHEVPCLRTLAVAMAPVPWRVSRRRINSDSVSVDTATALRDRHAFRVPVQLARAHDDIDRRDAELAAGFPEFSYLGLINLATTNRDDLDQATVATIDIAARCGIGLRPLHGRHAAAWPATLPFGLTPRRTFLGDH